MGSDRRRAQRVPCRLAVRLKGVGRPHIAHTKDLSRVGARLGLRRSELGIDEGADAQEVVRAVNQLVGPVVVAELHYEVLGALVRKGLRIVRIAVSAEQPKEIELGCDFSTVISDEEASFLGQSLPPIGEGVEIVEPEEPIAPICAYLCAADDAPDVVPLLTPIVSSSERGAVLRVSDPRRLPVLPDRDDIGARFEAVTSAYGSRLRLLVVHGAQPVWCGRARVNAVYRPTPTGGFDVEVVFEPPLGPGAKARLSPLTRAESVPTRAPEPAPVE